MGQGYSLTTLSAGSAGIDVPELSDLVYEKSMGGGRFMKSIRARQQNGLVFVKIIVKPYPSMKLERYIRSIIRERDLLSDVPNALSYERILETSTSGYLVRQYINSSLYDRMSTRPFLDDIEKKWIAFQLLCSLRDCHSLDVFHGDIKTENILVTSWNWLYLSDFSSSFKPTFLPEDNPADFSFYFDTSGRRTCYLAPERFLVADEEPGNRNVNWAMDIFSAGCVIAELFLETPIFTLSQMYKYRKGEYSPAHSLLAKIEDPEIRQLALHMIQIDPESRYSAEEYLNFWKNKAFPEYFYSFLHQYMSLMTDPSSGRANVDAESANRGEADDRIHRIYLDFDKISYFLGASPSCTENGSSHTTPKLTGSIWPMHLDLPNYSLQSTKSQLQAGDGVLIFLSLVVSNLRNTAKSSARLKACDILLALAERVSDEAKLDRILPYIMILLGDRADAVKIVAVRTLAQLLEMVHTVSPVNAYMFSEYIFLKLQPFISSPNSNPSPAVRAAYASCIASLAHSSLRFLDMIQSLRSDVRLTSLIPASSEPRWTEDATYHNLYDVARVDLINYFEAHTKALLTDNDSSVRRAFLGSVSNLCVFFGNLKANEVILGHLNTYLNDRDWILKCAFFEAVVGVASYVGSVSLEQYILPLMIQSITEPEEFVVERVFRSLAAMADLGLFRRSTIWDLLHIAVRFFVHPNAWIREAAAHFVVNSTRFISAADKYAMLAPVVRPFLKMNVMDFSETRILDTLKRPLPRNVYEMSIVWATKVEKGIFWKLTNREGMLGFSAGNGRHTRLGRKNPGFSMSAQPRNEEDERWLSRLRSLGMDPEDEFKLVALREYIWRVSRRSVKDTGAEPSVLNNIIPLTQLEVSPQTVFFDKNQSIRPRKGPVTKPERSKTEGQISHTIADALLDASTTIESIPNARKKPLQRKMQEQNEPVAALTAPEDAEPDNARIDQTHTNSPKASSPGAAIGSRQLHSQSTVGVGKSSDRQQNPGDDSSSTRTGSENSGLRNPSEGIQKRPSAVNLLNRKELSKAYAETSTSSANAFGKVDVPSQREPLQRTQVALGSRRELRKGQGEFRANHSYGGNEPVILNLLDSIFTENYPTDFFDLGPFVRDVDSRRPIRKAGEREEGKVWKPDGTLVTVFGEHSGPVNRVAVAPDHAFFATASDDGTVKIWDTTRLERNLMPRSRQTHRHAVGSKVKALTFVENTHTFVSGATDGSIHAVKVDYNNINESVRYGKLQIVREYQLPAMEDGSAEYAVWMEHFRSDSQSTLLVATSSCRILALDMKTMLPAYSLRNPVHHGAPTTFCCDKKHSWLLVGTTHGILNLWDLRFQIRLKAWGLTGAGAIQRLQIHPTKGRGRWVCVSSGGNRGNEITVWDIEKFRCREVFSADTVDVSAAVSSGGYHDPPDDNSVKSSNTRINAKCYEAWYVDNDRPEGMLNRFVSASPESAGIGRSGPCSSNAPAGISGFTVGYDMPDDGKGSSTRCGYMISVGRDRQIRFWDLNRPEHSAIISGLNTALSDGVTVKPRYELFQPSSNLLVTVERIPGNSPAIGMAEAGGKSGKKTASGRLPRNTVISLRQQQLLKHHLDFIQDVAVLRVPYGMVVSVDRAGMVYVFQ